MPVRRANKLMTIEYRPLSKRYYIEWMLTLIVFGVFCSTNGKVTGTAIANPAASNIILSSAASASGSTSASSSSSASISASAAAAAAAASSSSSSSSSVPSSSVSSSVVPSLHSGNIITNLNGQQIINSRNNAGNNGNNNSNNGNNNGGNNYSNHGSHNNNNNSHTNTNTNANVKSNANARINTIANHLNGNHQLTPASTSTNPGGNPSVVSNTAIANNINNAANILNSNIMMDPITVIAQNQTHHNANSLPGLNIAGAGGGGGGVGGEGATAAAGASAAAAIKPLDVDGGINSGSDSDGGNGNVSGVSIANGISQTPAKDKYDRCMGPADPGTCKQYTYKWRYEATTNECTSFIWGGCDGNPQNRFNTEAECLFYCIGAPYTLPPFLQSTSTAISLNNDVAPVPQTFTVSPIRTQTPPIPFEHRGPELTFAETGEEKTFVFAQNNTFIQIDGDAIQTFQLRLCREISFQFRTRLPHGLLVYHNVKNPEGIDLNPYALYVIVEKGQLKVVHVFGRHSTSVTVGEGLNRDEWHSVMVTLKPVCKIISPDFYNHMAAIRAISSTLNSLEWN